MNRLQRVRFALLLAPVLVAGCALGPRTVQPDVRLPPAYAAPAGAAEPQAALDRWWDLYGDRQLQGLVDQALVQAPDARIARARLTEAMAVRAGALAAYAPQGALQASASRTDTSVISGPPPLVLPGGQSLSLTNGGVSTAYGADFNVSWELDVFGRGRATRGKADADLARARFDAAAARASLAAQAADQLFQARALAIQLADARDSARVQRQLAQAARGRAAEGLVAATDADQAAAEAAEADAAVTGFAVQLTAARRALLVLIGRGTDPLDSLPVEAEAGAPPAVPATLPSALLARRPDVRAAAEALRSASGQLKLDELALLPTFALQPAGGINAYPLYGLPVTSGAWTLGAGMVQPILDLPRLKTQIRAQGARADQAAIAYEQTVRTAYGEAETALAELAADETRAALLAGAEAEARLAYDAARARYAAGIDDLTEVLVAERTWRAARLALTGARAQALRRSVQAFKALGGGWSPDAPLVEAADAGSVSRGAPGAH